MADNVFIDGLGAGVPAWSTETTQEKLLQKMTEGVSKDTAAGKQMIILLGKIQSQWLLTSSRELLHPFQTVFELSEGKPSAIILIWRPYVALLHDSESWYHQHQYYEFGI